MGSESIMQLGTLRANFRRGQGFTAAARLRGVELSPIKEIELRASKIPDVISLAQGIPSFDTPEPIKRFVEQRIAEGACARYSVTPGLLQLREAIAESLRAEGMVYDPDREVIVTAGSIEGIAAALFALIDPGDEVLVVSPTYASYIPAIQIAGGTARFVPLNEDANFDLDPDAIANAAGRHTRALLICNPNNPTGTVFSREQTLRMLEVAERMNLAVITDEVYKDFLYGDAKIFSAAMEPSARDRVLRVFSFSKAYAMTGWRVGFVHGPARLMSEVLKVHDALVTCAPVVSQYAALAALELGEEAIAGFRAEFRRRRDRVIERLDALSHVLDYQKPNASYFAFPRVKDIVPYARDSRRLALDLLERARVAVVPGAAFGPSGEAHLRICYARSAEDIDRAFDRMEDYFAGRPARSVSLPAAPPAQLAPRHPLRQIGVGALRLLARHYLRRTRPCVVAITGTQGKTVIKRLLHELLSRHFCVRANPLSYNTDVGLPLAILGCDMDTRTVAGVTTGFAHAAWTALFGTDAPQVLILELGVRRAGDMREHLELVTPDIAVLARLRPSLSDEQAELNVLRHEIAEICALARQQGRPRIIYCADDAALRELAAGLPLAHSFTRADAKGNNGALEITVGGEQFFTDRDIVGVSSLYGIQAAVHVARLLGLTNEAIRSFLAH